ncbi:MAG: hypothetical protein VYA38_00465 [Gemmatimonadota bacterium]|nr:hypothetical protein [Gemmatimonadota bacterium]
MKYSQLEGGIRGPALLPELDADRVVVVGSAPLVVLRFDPDARANEFAIERRDDRAER